MVVCVFGVSRSKNSHVCSHSSCTLHVEPVFILTKGMIFRRDPFLILSTSQLIPDSHSTLSLRRDRTRACLNQQSHRIPSHVGWAKVLRRHRAGAKWAPTWRLVDTESGQFVPNVISLPVPTWSCVGHNKELSANQHQRRTPCCVG
jgi:hypothetical protein